MNTSTRTKYGDCHETSKNPREFFTVYHIYCLDASCCSWSSTLRRCMGRRPSSSHNLCSLEFFKPKKSGRRRSRGMPQISEEKWTLKTCFYLPGRASAGSGRGGAIVCGKTGCNSSTGFQTKQAAVDEAYSQCQKQEYGDCQETNILGWWDEEGYAKEASPRGRTTKTCGPPPGSTARSTYQCSNGDCIRTFENGCAVRFQAPYCHDPFSGKWEWKPNGC